MELATVLRGRLIIHCLTILSTEIDIDSLTLIAGIRKVIKVKAQVSCLVLLVDQFVGSIDEVIQVIKVVIGVHADDLLVVLLGGQWW